MTTLHWTRLEFIKARKSPDKSPQGGGQGGTSGGVPQGGAGSGSSGRGASAAVQSDKPLAGASLVQLPGLPPMSLSHLSPRLSPSSSRTVSLAHLSSYLSHLSLVQLSHSVSLCLFRPYCVFGSVEGVHTKLCLWRACNSSNMLSTCLKACSGST